MIVIQKWYGRLGNNILQVLRSITAARILGHNRICLPPHSIISTDEIYLDSSNKSNSNLIFSGDFFDLREYNLDSPSTAELKSNADRFKRLLFPKEFFLDEGVDPRLTNPKYVTAHVRGGDVFDRKPHSMYVQPPLTYYRELLHIFPYLLMVKQDYRNPIVKPLAANDHVYDISCSEVQDFRSLMKAKNLALSASTFSYAAYLLSDNAESVTLPAYFYDLLPQGDWPLNLNLNKVELPNYLRVGEWRNGFCQRRKMLNYRYL